MKFIDMQFSVCIDSVCRGMSAAQALDTVKKAGFTAFEFWNWWEKDMKALKAEADARSLSCAAFCTRHIGLTDPARRAEYLEALKASLEQARFMGTHALITQCGDDTGAGRADQRRSVAEGLKEAAAVLDAFARGSGFDVTLLLEPLNGKIDHKGTFLEHSAEGCALVKEAASPRIKLLFDIYHQQITEGDIIRRLGALIGTVGHIHCAGNPGRGELYSGELDYRNIIAELARLGYQGGVGLEYFPQAEPEAGLVKIREMLPIL